MKLRNILALILALSMVFVLCACGGEEETNTETGEVTEDVKNDNTPVEENDHEVPDDTKPQVGEYIVTVVDEAGAPVYLAEVKFMKDSGDQIVKTDEDGKAKLVCVVTEVTATIESAPEGYTADTNVYSFDEQSLELTITLKAA